MKLQKKKYFIFAILIIAATLTSFYLINFKPKASKYTKAKLVFESIINDVGESNNAYHR